jgi:hypothetical protein
MAMNCQEITLRQADMWSPSDASYGDPSGEHVVVFLTSPSGPPVVVRERRHLRNDLRAPINLLLADQAHQPGHSIPEGREVPVGS